MVYSSSLLTQDRSFQSNEQPHWCNAKRKYYFRCRRSSTRQLPWRQWHEETPKIPSAECWQRRSPSTRHFPPRQHSNHQIVSCKTPRPCHRHILSFLLLNWAYNFKEWKRKRTMRKKKSHQNDQKGYTRQDPRNWFVHQYLVGYLYVITSLTSCRWVPMNEQWH